VSSPTQISHQKPAETSRAAAAGTSPIAALVDAFLDTVQLLFNPFDPARWLKLSALCLFLGGGTASAAFHWSLSALPGEIGFQDATAQLRAYLARLPGVFFLTFVLAVGLGVLIIYLRAVCRFALVETILHGEVRLRRGWQERRPLARSYFFWLLAALGALGGILGAGLLVALPSLRAQSGLEDRPLVDSIILSGVLLAEVVAGLVAGLLITLTDDFAVPIMFAEKLPLVAAWRRLFGLLRGEAGAFTLYFLLRLVVSVTIGVTVLFFLFPALVALFSGAIIVGALVVLTLQLAGLAWVWTSLTILVAGLALSILMGLLLMLLGAAGMPGQVFLQNFGMRFISPRLPALESLWQPDSRSSPQT